MKLRGPTAAIGLLFLFLCGVGESVLPRSPARTMSSPRLGRQSSTTRASRASSHRHRRNSGQSSSVTPASSATTTNSPATTAPMSVASSRTTSQRRPGSGASGGLTNAIDGGSTRPNVNRRRTNSGSKLLRRLSNSVAYDRNKIRAVMLGLDSGGKTTLLYQLKDGRRNTTIPTLGFNLEKFKHNDVEFTILDVGGLPLYRDVWQQYAGGRIEALIFVVDSTQFDRLTEARAMLLPLLFDSAALADVPLLVYANKSDAADPPADPKEIKHKLGLHVIERRPWRLQPASALTGEGLHDGLDWLIKAHQQ